MSGFTRYDFMNGKELKQELSRRFGTSTGSKRLPLNRNQSAFKYRLLFISDDLKNGINPYFSTYLNHLVHSSSSGGS